MAFVAAALSAEPRAWSNDPWKQQILNFTVASADVSGTATADALSSVAFVMVSGVELTSQPSFSGNVITLAFADPGATRAGQIIAYGR